jgi:hypothetical protein
MIQTQTFTRGNKQYTANYGTDAAGNFQLWIDETDLHESTQQPVRHIPEKIEIDFEQAEGKGLLNGIRTTWKKVLVGNSGKPIPGTGGPAPMRTNKTDLADFAAMFGDAFQKFMVNGLVRSKFGHNYQPLFDAAGAVIPDTSYDTTAAPTNNYQTHNADGTAIS